MAKINIELDLDWIDEEMSVDDSIKEQVIDGITSKITFKAQKEVDERVIKIAEEKTEKIIAEVLETKINKLKIPYKKNTWDDEVKYLSLSEFIGIKYEEYLTKQRLDENGNTPRYSGDAKISISEYFLKKYFEKEVTAKVTAMIQKARTDAELTIVKTMENTLKEQLSVDIIKRLNVPEMLKKLQEKAKMIEDTAK